MVEIILNRILRPLKKLLVEILTSFKCVSMSVFASLFRGRLSNLYLSFNAKEAFDGTGAQIQRLVTIYALSEYFSLGFIRTEFLNISVHPLDPFQSKKDYEAQLVRLNKFLAFSNAFTAPEGIVKIYISKLTIRKFLIEILKSVICQNPRELIILEPYPVSEFCRGLFDQLTLEISEKSIRKPDSSRSTLVIHYRQGVGGNVVYPGQRIPRQLHFASLLELMREVYSREKLPQETEIIVLTDAPDSITYYKPPFDQQVHWEGTPGYKDGMMTVQPVEFSVLGRFSSLPVKVFRGGNPLDAILIMAEADFLIMSKSSLSFIGALFNRQGVVYFPKDFWHRPLSKWISYDS